VEPDKLMEFSLSKAEELLLCGPHAITVCKKLFYRVPDMDLTRAYDYTADVIAKQRVSDEAQEGMKAFLEKRKPNWHPSKTKKAK
jgi:enoyl-CoA hydratase/carnithine racemase